MNDIIEPDHSPEEKDGRKGERSCSCGCLCNCGCATGDQASGESRTHSKAFPDGIIDAQINPG